MIILDFSVYLIVGENIIFNNIKKRVKIAYSRQKNAVLGSQL